nr:hypothetical protein [Tanacetum cinerariifolium]
MGPSVYPPAQQNPQPFYRPDYQFGYPQGKSKSFSGGYDPGLWSEVISRWESITINRLNNQTWSDNKAKLAFVENLLGESEKLMWQQWRTVFPEAYSALEAIADEPQNITSHVRQLILLEDPYRGSTDEQDRACRDLDRITSFMAIEEDDESDSDQEEEYYQPNHHTFMFHPGPPTKIAEMVQAVGSWKPNKELPVKSKECEHDWKENAVTNYTICCGILTTDIKTTTKVEEEKNFSNGEVKLLKELLKEKTEQVQQMIRDQAKEYYEKKAVMQKQEELWQSKESLLIRDLTNALKTIDQLRIEKERLEEQKDEEIKKLKAHRKEKKNTTTSPKVRKITNQLYNVKVEFDIPDCSAFGTTAIIDTGASACCINKKVVPKEALEPLTDDVFFNGINSRQQATHKIKQGSMKGGIRIEGDEITIYKKVTKIKTSNQTEIAEIAELENGELCKLDIINPDITIEDRPLKHVTPAMEDSFRRHVDSLLKIGAIRPSKSRHRTMAMIVNSGTTIDPVTGKEVKGKERMVFNYKSLNDNTYKDQYSLPGINTIIKRIGGAKIFSKFDLKSGFIKLPWMKNGTAFLVPGGLYEWLVMPFGLKNAPAVFQRKTDKCFKGTESFIAVYIDDILVFSKNEKEHSKHLERMLKICEDNGLVLSPTKMKIAVSTVDFLGAVIGEGTIKLQPHIIKIVNFNEEELKTKKGLRSFLGILNYARAHIPKLGIRLRPLYEKTNAYGDKRMKPSDYDLVRKIKEQVQKLPDLEIPPENAYIILETDGCMKGWGGQQRFTQWRKFYSPQCLSEEYEDHLRRSHEDFQPLLRIFTKTIFTHEEPGALYRHYQLKANQTPIRMDKSNAWRLVAQDLELSAAKEAVKAMKGFLEDDDARSDDSIFIVDPGWDDYCLQALKLNRPVPLFPEARRARIFHGDGDTNKEDTKHSKSCVTFPVFRTAVGPTTHTPYFAPEVTLAVMMLSSATHFFPIKRQIETYARKVDMEYNPSNLVFAEWLALKFYNHLEMDWYTKNALWVYWMRGDDEVVLSNEEVSDLKDENNDDEHEITEIFKIETNLFDYETPTKTYEDDKNKLNNEVDEPWSENEVPYEICDRICGSFHFKNGKSIAKPDLAYQKSFENFHKLDYELLVELQECWWKINDHECSPFSNWGDHIRGPYANINTAHDPYLNGRNGRARNNIDNQEKDEQHKEGRCDLFDDPA